MIHTPLHKQVLSPYQHHFILHHHWEHRHHDIQHHYLTNYCCLYYEHEFVLYHEHYQPWKPMHLNKPNNLFLHLIMIKEYDMLMQTSVLFEQNPHLCHVYRITVNNVTQATKRKNKVNWQLFKTEISTHKIWLTYISMIKYISLNLVRSSNYRTFLVPKSWDNMTIMIYIECCRYRNCFINPHLKPINKTQ